MSTVTRRTTRRARTPAGSTPQRSGKASPGSPLTFVAVEIPFYRSPKRNATTLVPKAKARVAASLCEPSGRVSIPTDSGTLDVRVTNSLDKFFLYMADRHRIFVRRLRGKPWPWTEDKVLQKMSTCNVFRLYDRVTQYIVRNVINAFVKDEPPSTHEAQLADFTDHFVRIVTFFAFKRIATWEMLEASTGGPGTLSRSTFDAEALIAVLEKQYLRKKAEGKQKGKRIEGTPDQEVVESLYTSAYKNQSVKQIPGWVFKSDEPMYLRHILQVQAMLEDGLPARILAQTSLEGVFSELKTWSGFGGQVLANSRHGVGADRPWHADS